MNGVRYFPGGAHPTAMVGLMGTVVGAVVVVALVLVGVWLTWISLRSERHQPKALRATAEADEAE